MARLDADNARCLSCGGTMRPTVAPVSVRFRDEFVTVPDFPHLRCESCGEELFTLEQSEQLQRAAADAVRTTQGLLSGVEIKGWRTAAGITQEELESALGVGAKTVTRWERGLVFQSATADRLMRLSIRFPAIYEVLRSGELYREGCGTASLYLERLLPRQRAATKAFFLNCYKPAGGAARPAAQTREVNGDAIASAA